MLVTFPQKDIKTLLWHDAASIALINRIIVEKPNSLIVLTGKKIGRKVLQREKETFRDCGFQLIKINKFHLEGALNLIFPKSQKYFLNTMCGYSLIAFSSTHFYTPQEIIHLFQLPSYYMVAVLVFAHQTLYTIPRLSAQNYFQNIQKYSYATSLGFMHIFFWLIQSHGFLH
jgi:hypothetical protein